MPRLPFQIAALLTLTLSAYMFAPQADFIPIDDGSLTFKNPLVTEISAETIRGVFSTYDPELYVPLTLMSYQVDYAIGGPNPMVFHITNLLLHLLNVTLVLLVVRQLSTNSWLPFIAAAVFAVHPLNTEAVMWVSGRKDLLSAFFFLGSLLTYCQYRKQDRRLPYYASLVLFTLALLSKVVTATLPLVFMIVDDVLRLKNTKTDTVRKIPYVLLATLFLYVGMHGKSLSVYFLSYFETFLLAGKSAAFYVEKFVLPFGLMPLYQQSLPINALSLEFIFPFAILGLMYLIAIASRPIDRMISFGILWYGITLLPSLANFARGEGWSIFYASDRYVYLPIIGLILALAAGIASVCHTKQHLKIAAASTLVVLLGLTHLSYKQAKLWLSPETLFSYVVERAPQTHLAHALLGILDLEIDHYEDAVAHLSKSSELAPNFPDGRAHLGLAIMKTGNINGGMAELTQTIAATPDYVPAYVYQAYGYILRGDTDEAVKTLDRILQMEPNNAKAYQLLGTIAEQRRDLEAAKQYYEISLKLNPRAVQAQAALVRLLQNM